MNKRLLGAVGGALLSLAGCNKPVEITGSNSIKPSAEDVQRQQIQSCVAEKTKALKGTFKIGDATIKKLAEDTCQPNAKPTVDIDLDGDGYAPPLDCDDEKATINPGAVEICDKVDQSCAKSDTNVVYYLDNDGDGFGGETKYANCVPAEVTSKVTMFGGDCNDRDKSINPAVKESVDGVEENCDGIIDENPGLTNAQKSFPNLVGAENLTAALSTLLDIFSKYDYSKDARFFLSTLGGYAYEGMKPLLVPIAMVGLADNIVDWSAPAIQYSIEHQFDQNERAAYAALIEQKLLPALAAYDHKVQKAYYEKLLEMKCADHNAEEIDCTQFFNKYLPENTTALNSAMSLSQADAGAHFIMLPAYDEKQAINAFIYRRIKEGYSAKDLEAIATRILGMLKPNQIAAADEEDEKTCQVKRTKDGYVATCTGLTHLSIKLDPPKDDARSFTITGSSNGGRTFMDCPLPPVKKVDVGKTAYDGAVTSCKPAKSTK